MVNTNPNFDDAEEWNDDAFFQFLMRQREAQLNAYLMTKITGEDPSGRAGNITKADKAQMIAELSDD